MAILAHYIKRTCVGPQWLAKLIDEAPGDVRISHIPATQGVVAHHDGRVVVRLRRGIVVVAAHRLTSVDSLVIEVGLTAIAGYHLEHSVSPCCGWDRCRAALRAKDSFTTTLMFLRAGASLGAIISSITRSTTKAVPLS